MRMAVCGAESGAHKGRARAGSVARRRVFSDAVQEDNVRKFQASTLSGSSNSDSDAMPIRLSFSTNVVRFK